MDLAYSDIARVTIQRKGQVCFWRRDTVEGFGFWCGRPEKIVAILLHEGVPVPPDELRKLGTARVVNILGNGLGLAILAGVIYVLVR